MIQKQSNILLSSLDITIASVNIDSIKPTKITSEITNKLTK